jgi:hypothetical protein
MCIIVQAKVFDSLIFFYFRKKKLNGNFYMPLNPNVLILCNDNFKLIKIVMLILQFFFLFLITYVDVVFQEVVTQLSEGWSDM